MTEPEWRAANRANWDERVPLHVASDMYDLTGLKSGPPELDPIVTDLLGPVAGQRILHLQCHFGRDTLTLARMGASEAVGVDFSPAAIATAQSLAKSLNLPTARFIVSDVYEIPRDLGLFDKILVSWGALCWLPDMKAWATIIASHLKPGGHLALADAHPTAYVFDSLKADQDGRPGWYWPYFARSPMFEDRAQDYADPSAILKNTRTWEWLHPIADILGALLAAGLSIDRFEEYDRVLWRMFDCLVKGEDRFWRWPDQPWLPLAFGLRATRRIWA
jgi:SAM-dependent methyltransferase